MSGPKTSRYDLEKERRRQMEEQLRIRRATKAAQDRYRSLYGKNQRNLSELDRLLAKLEGLRAESGKGGAEAADFKEQGESLKRMLKSGKRNLDDVPLEQLITENEKLEKTGKQIWSVLLQCRETVRYLGSELKQELTEEIAGGFETSFSGLGSDRKFKDNACEKKINDALKKIEEIDLSQEMQDKFDSLKKRAAGITSLEFLENFCSMQVYPFVEECEYYRDHWAEYEELLSRYHYLTEEVGEPAMIFHFSANTIKRLEQEIARLEEQEMDQKAQIYISEAIDEAMLELGYELVGERQVVKKNGKKFRNGLYHLEDGVGVNVTFSDSGQISMELGALDTEDRMPAESEAVELADDMRAFCCDYAELERKLAKKGIVTKRISALPPSAEYAQVINTTEYDLKRPLETYSKEKSRKKAVSANYLHREG